MAGGGTNITIFKATNTISICPWLFGMRELLRLLLILLLLLLGLNGEIEQRNIVDFHIFTWIKFRICWYNEIIR